jgi:hypothetical protein
MKVEPDAYIKRLFSKAHTCVKNAKRCEVTGNLRRLSKWVNEANRLLNKASFGCAKHHLKFKIV